MDDSTVITDKYFNKLSTFLDDKLSKSIFKRILLVLLMIILGPFMILAYIIFILIEVIIRGTIAPIKYIIYGKDV